MEILSNIWNALSMENETLINMLSIPCTFLEIYIIFMIFTSIFKMNYTKRQSIVFNLLTSLTAIISYLTISAPFYSLIDYLVIFMLIKVVFKIGAIKSVFAVICSFAIYGLTGNLCLTLLIKIFGISFEEITIIPIYRLIYLFTSYLFLFIISKLLRKNKFHIRLFDINIFTNKIVHFLSLLNIWEKYFCRKILS